MTLRNAFISMCLLAGFLAVASSKAQNTIDYQLLTIKNSPKFTEWSATYDGQPLKEGYYKTDTATAQNDIIFFHINDNGNLTDSMKVYQYGALSVTATFDDGHLREHKLYRRRNGSLRQQIVAEGDAHRRYLYDDNGFLYEERLETGKRKIAYKKRRNADGIIEIETDYQNNIERILENGVVISEYQINDDNNEKKPLILDHRKE